MGKHKTARKLAMQALYQYQIQKANAEDILDYTINKDTYVKSTQDYAAEIFNGVMLYNVSIDALISLYAKDWKVDRLAGIDLAILRVSIWELLFTDEEVKVIISEAIDLVRQFSVEEAIKFINGILGKIAPKRVKYHKEALATCSPE